MTMRLLVMGDNHGDTESLERVLADVEGERFDAVVHVGDLTRAMRESRQREDEERGREIGAQQLRRVEPVLERFDDLADHGLVWVYGNQDNFGDLGYDLDVGTEVPDDDLVSVGGLPFTSDPQRVDRDVVLLTHMEHWRLVDHFDGAAHFCGNTHRGRRIGRRLNASFLQYRHPESGEKVFGGYFVVELGEGTVDVELRSIGSLDPIECDRHRDRGLQYQPPERGCMFCNDRRALFRELSASGFYGLVDDPERETVARSALVDYAVELRADPAPEFESAFAVYLAEVDDDRYAPLTSVDGDQLELAEPSYAF